MKRRTNLLAVLLSVTMTASAAASSFPVLAQSDADTVMPADASLVEETISFRKTTGTTNKFTFSSGNWEAGNNDHTWSKTLDAANPSAIWYQVDFVGSEITVYAGKNHPMGKVEYFIDGESQGVYDLYNASNINSTRIATFSGLSEEAHVFKAVATGEKNASASNTLIDCANVVIKHAPYTLTSISSEETHYDLYAGAEQQLSIAAVPDYATTGNLTYTSSDSEIVSVSSTGLVQAKKAGTATVSVTSDALPAAQPLVISFTVTEAQAELSGSIVDTNHQYTQSTYDSVKTMGTLSKTLSAWKNDKAVSQLVLVSKNAPLTNLSITASDLSGTGSAKIAKENVKLDFIQSTKAYNGSFLGYGSTTRPVPADNGTNRSESSDILNGNAPITLAASRVQPVWVEIAIPEDTAAGTYTGKLSATADGLEHPIEFTYTVAVRDAVLPDATDFKNSFDIELWQYPYSSAEYYGVTPFSDEHLELLRSSMEIYKEIGGHVITATISEEAWSGQTYSANDIHYPSMVKWTKNADGTFTYDFTAFDKWVSFCKSMGIGDKIVLYSIAPWHGSFTYWDNGTLVKEAFTAGSARYNEVWGDFLEKMGAHLVQKGWFNDAYIGIDERGFNTSAFDLIDSTQISDGQYTVTFKTTGSMDGFTNASKFAMALRLTELNVGDNAAAAHSKEFADLVAQRDAKGLRTALYSCTEHSPGNFSLSAPVESYWSVINASENTDGFMRWAYDAWVADPLRDTTHNAFEPGDCFLIYPDEKEAKNPTSKRSLRLARMAEGVRDANKLRQMAEEVPDLEGAIQSLYDSLTTVAGTAHSYLGEAKVNTMGSEMDAFKEGIDTLTTQYIVKKANATDTVTSVTITPPQSTALQIGQSLQLEAVVAPDTLTDHRVTWSSSESSVASVNADGLVTAAGTGTVTITAASVKDPTKTATITLSVSRGGIEESKRYSAYSFENSANDLWGNRNGTPIVESGLSYVDGYSGKGLHMNAGSGLSFTKSEIGNSDPWTITYWVKADTITGKSLITQDSEEKFATALKMADDRNSGFRVGTSSADVLTFAYGFEAGQWYHVAWTQSKTNGLKLYVNGEEVATNTWTTNNTTVIPSDILGKSDFAGTVDELRIYDAELTKAEIGIDQLKPGLNITVRNKTLQISKDSTPTWQIPVTLNSDEELEITYTSKNPEVATVSSTGVVTPVKAGTAQIEVKAGTYTETVTITVERQITLMKTVPYYDLPEKFVTDVHKPADGDANQYFGQPDMIRTNTGRLITAFPQGHGHGPLIMKYSDDDGETWIQKDDIPTSWATSMETPTMYVLNLADGTERIMLITAMPNWSGNQNGGWRTSYSDDNGETWTEYQLFHPKNDDGSNRWTIVGMSSLIQLKDENGNDRQAWMGIYHDYSYTNYKSILTFDEDGNEQWSDPEPILTPYRNIESANQLCELGLFRSPDGKRIVALARNQTHQGYAMMTYSDDEGETWSKPTNLPGNLAGERHKVVYDPISDRLVITYRDIVYDKDGNGIHDNSNDWVAGEWVMWVGSYEDLMTQGDGDYMVTIAYDYAPNEKSGDTGYAGLLVLDDGTLMMDSYGHFDEEYSKNHGSNVRTDRCYIKFAKFKLGDIEETYGLTDKSALRTYVNGSAISSVREADFTAESFAPFKGALEQANTILSGSSYQQIEVDRALKALQDAYAGLIPADGLNRKPLEMVCAKADRLNLSRFRLTSAQKDAFNQALAQAHEVLSSSSTTQSALDAQALAMQNRLLALRLNPGKEALNTLK